MDRTGEGEFPGDFRNGSLDYGWDTFDENIFGDADSGTDDISLDSPRLEHIPVLSPSIQETHSSRPDAAFGELQSTVFFQNSYKNTLPATPESEYVRKDDRLFLSDTENLGGNVNEGGSVSDDDDDEDEDDDDDDDE